MRKFKFRGYDNPSIEGKSSVFQYGMFTVGEVYGVYLVGTYISLRDDAKFTDDAGEGCWEELIYFDEVTDE